MKVLAKDVMEKKVKTVGPDMPFADLERRFVDDAVSGFPVIDSDQAIRGVVSASDVLAQVCEERADVEMATSFYDEDVQVEFSSVSSDWVSAEVGKRTDHLFVRDLMKEHVISVTPDTPLHDVAALMTKKKIHRVLVIEDKRLVGVISSADIVRACGNDLVDISFIAPQTLDF
jgi:CBS domain-containing protein